MPAEPLNAKDIFVDLVNLADPAEWESQLAARCGGDAALADRVRALLRAHADPDSFLDKPAIGDGETADYSGVALNQTGQRIGPYKVLQQIGEGGMGVVYMAEQTEPVERRLALKIIKPGMDTRRVVARFEAERQALAMMDHPNIARVLDAGATKEGLPYVAMELVRGVPITEYCDANRLSPRERLELFVPVCNAVQHAHQKGIIHRDLKPSNVMVASYDGRPAPKVIDFGVAKATGQKLTDKTMFTEFGAVIGTLEYMSPEQAELNQLDVDTRSDVYALGVLLYELLTGATPLDRKRFEQTAMHEILRVIREEEPPRPSTRISTVADAPAIAEKRATLPERLGGFLRGEIDWIVMKTLEKDRSRRYESASALGADLQRFLDGDAVEACPPSTFYRIRKLASRNKVAISTATLVAASLLLGIAVSLWQMSAARRAEAWAEQRLVEAVAARERADRAEALATDRLHAEEEARRAATLEADRARQLADFLASALESASPDSGNSAGYTVRELLDDFAAVELPRLKSQPELRARFQLLLGNAYSLLAMPEQAAPHLDAALATVEKLIPSDEASLARTLLGVAIVRMMEGKHTKQLEAARRAADTFDRLGIVDEDSLEALHLVQLAWLALEEPSKAIEVYEQAEAIIATADQPIANFANVMHDQARALSRLGEYDAAEAIAREAVKTHVELHGPRHRETGWGRHILGNTLLMRGNHAEAVTELREAFDVFTRIYGNSHFSVRSTFALLLRALSLVGDTQAIDALRSQFPEMMDAAADFAVATRSFPVERARGKTITYSGWIKTEELHHYAALWWRASKESGIVAFDNMSSRAPTGTTDWRRYTIALDIPEETTEIVYGVLMSGSGRAWFDSLEIAIDGEPQEEETIDFETDSPDEFYVPIRAGYETQIDRAVAHAGSQSLRMAGVSLEPPDTGTREISVAILDSYEGRYVAEGDEDLELFVQRDGAKLVVTMPRSAPMQLTARSSTRFAYGDMTLTFKEVDDGSVGSVGVERFGDDFTATRREPVVLTGEALARFIGEYRHSADLSFSVSVDGDHLMVRLTGQQAVRVYPRTETRFYYRVVVAEIEFRESDDGSIDGLTLYQNGMVLHADRVANADDR